MSRAKKKIACRDHSLDMKEDGGHLDPAERDIRVCFKSNFGDWFFIMKLNGSNGSKRVIVTLAFFMLWLVLGGELIGFVLLKLEEDVGNLNQKLRKLFTFLNSIILVISIFGKG